MTADRYAITAVNGFVAFPVGARAASFAEDGDKSCDIPGGHERINGDFGAAGGNQHVPAAVAPASGDTHVVHYFDDGIESICFAPVCWFGEHQPGIAEFGCCGRIGLPRWLVANLPPASGTVGGVNDFVEGRKAANAGCHAVFEFDADEGSEEGDTMNKGLGSINGIDNPAVAAAARNAGKLFTENRIIRVKLLDAAANERFCVAVSNGDWRFVRLGFHKQPITLIMLKDEQPRIMGELEGRLESLRKCGHN